MPFTRPIVREPAVKVIRPRPVSSIKDMQMTKYEPSWYQKLKKGN